MTRPSRPRLALGAALATALLSGALVAASTSASAPTDRDVPALVPRAPLSRPATTKLDPAELAIDGQVVDDRGQPVPDVHVQVGAGADARDVVTDGGGRFAVTALRDGRYSVAVQDLVSGQPSGVVHHGAARVAIVVPAPTSHGVQLVVRRVGAIAWSRHVPPPARDIVTHASVSLVPGAP